MAPPLADEVEIVVVFKVLVPETEIEPKAVAPTIPLKIALPVTLKLCVPAMVALSVLPKVTVPVVMLSGAAAVSKVVAPEYVCVLAPPLADEVEIAVVFNVLVPETKSEPKAVVPTMPLNTALPVTLKL